MTELKAFGVQEQANNLSECYPSDLSSSFSNECVHFLSCTLVRAIEKKRRKNVYQNSFINARNATQDNGIQNIYPRVSAARRSERR